MEEKKNRRKWIIIALILALLLGIGGCIVMQKNKPVETPTPTGVVEAPVDNPSVEYKILNRVVEIKVGDTYDPNSNLELGEGTAVEFKTDFDNTVAGEYIVNVSLKGGKDTKEDSFMIRVIGEVGETDKPIDGEQTGCVSSKKWIVDKAAYDEEVWIEGGTKTIHHDEEGHYKVTHHDEVGHYEPHEENTWVIDVPAKEATGHYKTVHHDAVTHEEVKDVYDDVEWIIYTLWDGSKVEYRSSEIGDPTLFDGVDWESWRNDYRYEVVGTETITVTDKEAWDEQVWVEDSPAQEEKGHWESKKTQTWVVDQAAWDEKTWIVDKKAWDETKNVPGHYETVHHDEEGHWEESGC